LYFIISAALGRKRNIDKQAVCQYQQVEATMFSQLTTAVPPLPPPPLRLFNGLFSRTTWRRWYQKGKTSLDLNVARGYGVLGWQWHQLDHMKQSAPHCRQITTPKPHHSIIYRLDALHDAQPMV